MKKIITSIILIFCLSSPSFGFVALAIPLWYVGASVALHVAAGLGIYYAMTPNGTSNVGSDGAVSRGSKVTWVDLNSNSVQEKDISASLSYDQIKSISSASPSSYPYLATASKVQTPGSSVITPDKDSILSPGAYVNVNGNTYQITSARNHVVGVNWSHTDVLQAGQGNLYIYFDKTTEYNSTYGYKYGGVDTYAMTPATPPPPAYVSATPSQFAANIAASGSSGSVKSLYQAELDKMMQDPSYVPTFTDSTTGLPFTPPAPSSVMTPSQLTAYNTNGLAQDAKNTASASTAAAASSSAAAANTAAATYSASGGNPATGSGGDPALYQKYLDAKAIADRAQAAKDKLAADQAAADAAKAGSANIVAPGAPGAYGDGSPVPGASEYTSRFNQFISTMRTSGIFSMPQQVFGNIPGGGTSTFNFAFGRFGNHTFDLSSYGAAISVLRTLFLIIFSIIGFKIIALKGGGG